MSDEIETIDKNPKSWADWKSEAQRLQAIIDAMLKQSTDSCQLSGNSEQVTQFKPVADLYELRRAGHFVEYTLHAGRADQYAKQDGCEVVQYVKLSRLQDAMAGNSPVIPDGWKLVPVEPTEEMVIDGFESEPDKFFSSDDEWESYAAMSGCEQAAHRARLCYSAMLAAAPQPDHFPDATKMVSAAVRDVIAERRRQITAEGWTPEHDDAHSSGELARAAACYAQMSVREKFLSDGEYAASQKKLPFDWPWEPVWWKPTNPRRDLVKAGALILAEIDRLDRTSQSGGGNRG